MLYLNTTTKALRLSLGAAGTIPYTTQWIDTDAYAVLTFGSSDGYSAGTSPVNIVASPADGYYRKIVGVNLYNTTTADVTATIQLNDNGTLAKILSITLKTLETLQYVDGDGWNVMDSYGWIKTDGSCNKYNWKKTGWINYVNTKLIPHMKRQQDKGGGTVTANYFTTGYTLSDDETMGGVLAPNENIYLVPGWNSSTTWYYCNTKTLAFGTYTGYNLGGAKNYYWGGACDRNGIIWLAPYGQANASKYHYINSTNNTVTEVTHGLGADTPVTNGYRGGVLSPDGSKVFLIPSAQSSVAKWHYVDTASKTYVAYSHGMGTSFGSGIFTGGVLAGDGKIYLIPGKNAYDTTWYYIDPATQTVGSYENGLNHAIGRNNVTEYAGGVLAPNNKIYLIPYERSYGGYTTWGGIDLSSGSPTGFSYTALNLTGYAYVTGAISLDGKIFFGMNDNGESSTQYYINTKTNAVTSYTISLGGSVGGVVTDRYGRIWMIGRRAYGKTRQYYITTEPKGWWSNIMATSPIYNKW